MKKFLLLILVLGMSLALSNCVSNNKQAPDLSVRPLELARANYSISGETSGQECAFMLFHVNWGSLFGWDSGYIGKAPTMLAPEFWLENTLLTRATFNALAKMPDANFVLSPKIDTETTTYFIFGKQQCVTVKAKAIVLKNGPVK